MPLKVSNESAAEILESLKSAGSKPIYLAVYASYTDGQSWCSDTRKAEPLLEAKFDDKADTVKIVFAGQKEEWRKQDNPWRQAPFLVTALPTLIKFTDAKWERLVEEDVYDQNKLDAFVE